MLRIVVCLAVLLSMAAAQPRKYCCVPKQWEALDGFIQGIASPFETPQLQNGSAMVAYDADIQKIASKVMVYVQGKTIAMRILQDYSKGTQYVVQGQNCTKTKLPAWQEYCVPDSASAYPLRFGLGKDSLEAVAYSFVRDGMMFSLTTTRKGCVPVGQTVYGTTSGVSVLQTAGFVNVTPGIKDPSVFDVPPQCNGVEVSHTTHKGDGMVGMMMGRH